MCHRHGGGEENKTEYTKKSGHEKPLGRRIFFYFDLMMNEDGAAVEIQRSLRQHDTALRFLP